MSIHFDFLLFGFGLPRTDKAKTIPESALSTAQWFLSKSSDALLNQLIHVPKEIRTFESPAAISVLLSVL